ncbi:alanyl-tRNA editing protein [Vibrio sp.]|uniref:alanyl-tRNA editing protein n=1 Tax=Vibrio sp. TaxID=678 RepID=UPI003D14003D
MSLQPTLSFFCHQTWQMQATVQRLERQDGIFCLITDRSPFHPVSHIWPDHPADQGQVSSTTENWDVTDCQMGAVCLETDELFIGKHIPVKRGEEGWIFVVVHCIRSVGQPCTLAHGDTVTLQVDQDYQLKLSQGHSAGHIAALALNKVLAAGYWRKQPDRLDTHGFPDFNSYAQHTSQVIPAGCIDVYRLGKTLRKRGLNHLLLLDELDAIAEKVNQQLSVWLAQKRPIEMNCHGPAITDSRYWHCDLGEVTPAVIPCGGTHVTTTRQLQQITVSLCQIDDQHIEMRTSVTQSV